MAAAACVGACSSDDDGGSGGSSPGCHCEWGDTCDEMPAAECPHTECESNGQDVKASGACTDMDVIGTCTCAAEDTVIYYRSSFAGNPADDCDFWCDGTYTAR